MLCLDIIKAVEKKREGNHQCFLRVSDLKICVAIGVFVIYIYYLFIVYI